MPETVTYTEARQNFEKYMDQVCDDHDAFIVTRQKSRPIVRDVFATTCPGGAPSESTPGTACSTDLKAIAFCA